MHREYLGVKHDLSETYSKMLQRNVSLCIYEYM